MKKKYEKQPYPFNNYNEYMKFMNKDMKKNPRKWDISPEDPINEGYSLLFNTIDLAEYDCGYLIDGEYTYNILKERVKPTDTISMIGKGLGYFLFNYVDSNGKIYRGFGHDCNYYIQDKDVDKLTEIPVKKLT